MSSGLQVTHVWQGYRGVSTQGWRLGADVSWVLRDLSFTVASGEMLGVMGTNGSGKTTLLQTIAGVLEPMRGSVTAAGRVTSLVDLSAGFHRELTGRENLRLAGVLLGLPRSTVRARYDEIVAFSGLDDETLDTPLRTYSSGMGLRLGFSLVAHSEPAALVVDEVLAVGDEEFRSRCVDKIQELRAGGCAIVLVSHDLDLIASQCDRAGILHRGRLDDVGPPSDVVTRYAETHEKSPVVSPSPKDGRRPNRHPRRRRFL